MSTSAPDSIGDFRIESEIGRGGMGVVYEATQMSLGRRVALKVLPGMVASYPGAVERFHREATAAAKLSHPGIVQVHEAGEVDGLHFIAMELVDGQPLSDLIHHVWTTPQAPPKITPASGAEVTFHVDTSQLSGSAATPKTGAPGKDAEDPPGKRWNADLRRGVAAIAEAARAIGAAHDAGILHRDVKPGNLLVTPEGRAKVVDFGLARSDDEGYRLTRTGDVMGTPSYMSPEQFQPGGKKVDHRTDVYALGVTLFELLTGKLPFHGPNVQVVVHQITHKEPPQIRKLNPAIPRDLETICLKALEKSPGQRYAKAADMADDLERFLRGEPIAARPSGPVTRLIKWVRRRPAAALVTATISAAVVVIVVLLAQSRSHDHEDAHAAARDAVTEGIVLSVLRDSSRAVSAYDRAMALDADCFEAYVQRGVEHLFRDRRDEARRDIERAREMSPNDAAVRFAWAAWLRAEGRSEEADALTANCTATAIDEPLTLDSIGLVHVLRARPLEALPYFRRARSIDQRRLSSISGVAWCSFALGRYDDADKAYDLISDLIPDDAVSRLFRIYILFHRARTATGRYQFQLREAARLLLAEVEEIVGTTTVSLLACAAIDSVSPEGERSRDVQRCVAEALELQPTATETKNQLPPVLVHSVAASVLVGATPKVARSEAEAALQMGARIDLPRLVLGRLEQDAGALDAARNWYTRALEAAPQSAMALEALWRFPTPLPDPRRLELARALARVLPDDAGLSEEAGRLLLQHEERPLGRVALSHAVRRYRADGFPDQARRLQAELAE